jgi:PhnB protein
MATNLPQNMPRIIPMMAYEDVAAALDWLAAAFGFRERMRYEEPDGRITHAEMEMGEGVIMLSNPTPDYQSPNRHREACEIARAWSTVPWVIDGLLVYVDDVDKHFEQADEAGATILSEPQDQTYGDRNYRAEDLEGHRWMFATHIRDVAPQEW